MIDGRYGYKMYRYPSIFGCVHILAHTWMFTYSSTLGCIHILVFVDVYISYYTRCMHILGFLVLLWGLPLVVAVSRLRVHFD